MVLELGNKNRCDEKDRGQLLLLSAIAILLVVIVGATIINTASYSEFDRVSGVDDKTNDAVHQVEDTEKIIEALIRHTNHDADGEVSVSEELSNGEFVESINTNLNAQGKQVSVTDVSVNDGVRIWRGESAGDLTKNGNTDYSLVTDNADVRAFALQVTGENLANEGDANEFTIELGDGDDVSIGTNINGEVVVNGECNVEASKSNPARISVTDGTVNGITCSELPSSNSVNEIGFENANNVNATFNVVTNREFGEIGDEFDEQETPSGNPDEIEAHSAVYSIDMIVTSKTPETTIEAPITVAPQLGQAAIRSE